MRIRISPKAEEYIKGKTGVVTIRMVMSGG
ncbi:hypothetical protein TAMC210_23110 [Thermanaeromonas sp. C210]|nr:MAG: hypothetical protein XD51_0012 [Moorella sp. 60_41]GFN23994.1 hypothetical protein TAMC210_23110 [Thermanaeromonas sp. C210]